MNLSPFADAIGSAMAATLAVLRPSPDESAMERAMGRLDRVADRIENRAPLPPDCVIDDIVDRLR